MSLKDSGILHCAIGTENFERAKISLGSIKKQNHSIKTAIYTDQENGLEAWDHVIKAKRYTDISFSNEMIVKLDALLQSPFLETLYLDADTYILDDISEIFKLCPSFDLAFCHGHNRYRRFRLIQDEQEAFLKKEIPYCFAPIQGGVILFNTFRTKDFFEELKNRYLSTGYFDDQAIIREMLWEKRLKFYVLPPEYNFNSLAFIKKWRLNPVEARPKIFHYTQHKEHNIEKLVEKAYKRRYWLQKFILKLKIFIHDLRYK